MNIRISNDTEFNVDLEKIKTSVEKVFQKNGREDVSVSITVVSREKLAELAISYMGDTPEEAIEHPVLTFLSSEVETDFVLPPDMKNYLGEMVISYDKSETEMVHWAEHGALHLIGIHHD